VLVLGEEVADGAARALLCVVNMPDFRYRPLLVENQPSTAPNPLRGEAFWDAGELLAQKLPVVVKERVGRR
jgi:hypothetical protein